MSGTIEVDAHGAEALPRVQALWELLFDHHLAIGAAGLPVIPREESWPLRRAHYEGLFAGRPNTELRLATLDGEAIGYAMSFEDLVGGERTMVLETLSVSPAIRGRGIGTRLMDAVRDAAIRFGIEFGAVDVMGGNPRARDLYLRNGYRPHSETWMRTAGPVGDAGTGGAAGSGGGLPASESPAVRESLARTAASLGLSLSFAPGPDDTWQTSDEIADLADRAPGSPGFGHGSARHDDDRLAELFADLAAAGLRTVRFELPARPAAGRLRALLESRGFHLSTERLLAPVRSGSARPR